MDVKKEVEFFDRFASQHQDYDVLGEGAYRRLLALFTALARPKPGERCIDLGCGTGAFTQRVRRFGLELTGMDISPASIERANATSQGERYLVGDIRETGLAAASFDIVVLSGVLHHLLTRDIRRQVLAESARILKPGGRVWSFDPSAHSPSMRLYRDPRSPLYSAKGKTENEVLIDRHELAQDLRDAGFADVGVRGAAGITYAYIEGRVARLVLPLYNVYERVLRRSPFEDRWGTFLIGSGVRP
jgi:SAM-dependent methyltransferase